METKKIRYPLLDNIRGITLVSMMLFHAMWDIVYIYDMDVAWYRGTGAYIWQQSICWTFILLSGFCWSLGHRKWKRGLSVFCAGLVITIVTLVFLPEDRVVFGVLTLLGTCMLITIPMDIIFKRIPTIAGILISIILFFLFRNINTGYLGFERWNLISLPICLYSNMITTFFGFTESSFYSTDYFSVFPWIFLFWTGYFLNRLCTQNGYIAVMKWKGFDAFEKLGKNSLLVYMLHQPLIYGILYVVMKLIK